MQEYTLGVDFKNKQIYGPTIELVQNDHNSTKLNFNFAETYDKFIKTIEIKYPSGAKLIDEIKDNAFIIKDILVENGEYEYEVVIYDEESKLTNFATGNLFVREQLVKDSDEEIKLESEYPILNQLIIDTKEALTQANNLNVNAEKVDGVITLEITKKDGSTESVEIYDGSGAGEVTEEVKKEIIDDAVETVKPELNKKVDKVTGKGLSTNDFTNDYKTKLDGLSNYDDSSLKSQISDLNENKANKANVYTKEEVDSKVSSIYRYKGSVDSYGKLPTENLVIGDAYNVLDTGANYAWTGTYWDKLSETIDLTPYMTKEEAEKTYAKPSSIPRNTSDLNNDSDFVSDKNYVHTDNNYSSDEKTKLAGIETGAQVNPDLSNYTQKSSIITETTETLILENNQDARLEELTSLILTMPETIDDHYESEFSFQSGETATTLTYSGTPLIFVGDDVDSEGSFIPEANTIYEISIKNLGINGIIARVGSV